MSDLRGRGLPWPAEIEAVQRWYAPHLERRHEDADIRMTDLVQLAQIAAGSASRSEFLVDLTLDPPGATGDLSGPPLRDDDYLILSTIHSAKGQEWRTVHLLSVVDGCMPSDLGAGTTAGDRGGAPAALCRNDESRGRPPSGPPASLLHPWPGQGWGPPCLCVAQPVHTARAASAFRDDDVVERDCGARAGASAARTRVDVGAKLRAMWS